MSVTLQDVAREAGVSIRTVSRVINNRAEIAATTRQRVQAVIDQLEYRPNTLARGLVMGRTRSVAVVIPQITNPFFPEFVQGVESVARDQDYHVFLCNTDENAEQEFKTLDALASKQVDGVVLCGTRLSQEQLARAATQLKLVVVTSRTLADIPVINTLGRDGLQQITQHLIQLGHCQIGHIGWVQPGSSDRLDGYKEALRQNNLRVKDENIEIVNRAVIEQGRAATHALLARSPELTALTCYNDLVAIGVLQACAARSLQVPQEMAVVGFDDVQLASLVTPALTTMRVPRHHLGQTAMRLLLELMIEHPHTGQDATPHRINIPTSLVIRESCGGKEADSVNCGGKGHEE